MAASGPSQDYFSPGSIVKCISMHEKEIQGEVLDFDLEKKILTLKTQSSCGKSDLHNVVFLNVNNVRHIEIVQKNNVSLPAITALSSSKLRERLKQEVDQKMTLAKARTAGATMEGIQLYLYLRKALPVQTVSWQQQDILVMDEVLVKPPYQLDNCIPCDLKQQNTAGQCLAHIKNVVERFHREERSKLAAQGSTLNS